MKNGPVSGCRVIGHGHLDAGHLDAGTFGCRDIWMPRHLDAGHLDAGHLDAGTFGCRDIWMPDIWMPGHLDAGHLDAVFKFCVFKPMEPSRMFQNVLICSTEDPEHDI
ncbi:hypothetical protein Ddc_10228 [Ditylenchus destructor]|nr:hypothetical protein Ddc_10228 [Ditylenchus destructor]